MTEVAKEFILKFMKNNNFVGIHWRYDENYEFHCKISSGIGNRKACAHILGHGFDLKDIAGRMRSKFAEWEGKGWVGGKVDKVFIAAPPSSNATVRELGVELGKFGVDIWWSEKLMMFVRKKFENCGEARFLEQIHDYSASQNLIFG